jgi:hypothetical protein
VPAVSWNGQIAAWVAARSRGSPCCRSISGYSNCGCTRGRSTPGVRDGVGVPAWRSPNAGIWSRRSPGASSSTSTPADSSPGGRVAVPLRDGLGSIVTYASGQTDIGSWDQEVPAPGRPVASVRQNLSLLIDNGRPAASVGCVSCWGATLGGVSDPARSARLTLAPNASGSPPTCTGIKVASHDPHQSRSCPVNPAYPDSSSFPTAGTSSRSWPGECAQVDGLAWTKRHTSTVTWPRLGSRWERPSVSRRGRSGLADSSSPVRSGRCLDSRWDH